MAKEYFNSFILDFLICRENLIRDEKENVFSAVIKGFNAPSFMRNKKRNSSVYGIDGILKDIRELLKKGHRPNFNNVLLAIDEGYVDVVKFLYFETEFTYTSVVGEEFDLFFNRIKKYRISYGSRMFKSVEMTDVLFEAGALIHPKL